jgi:hypothetical protein
MHLALFLKAGCDTYFVFYSEIGPKLGSSVEKFDLSISFISIYQVTDESFTEFGIIRSQEMPNLEPVKTFVS